MTSAFQKALAHWVMERRGLPKGPVNQRQVPGPPNCVHAALGASALRRLSK